MENLYQEQRYFTAKLCLLSKLTKFKTDQCPGWKKYCFLLENLLCSSNHEFCMKKMPISEELQIPTNIINFNQYFKDKLSSHQPSHLYNTRHRTNNNFNIPLFDHSKTQKYYLYQVIPIWNSPPSLLKNFTSKFTFKKQIKSHLLASQS